MSSFPIASSGFDSVLAEADLVVALDATCDVRCSIDNELEIATLRLREFLRLKKHSFVPRQKSAPVS